MAAWRQRRRDTELLEARRWEAWELLRSGTPPGKVARDLGVSRAAVSKWAARVREHGPGALRAVRRGGRPPLVAARRRRLLSEILRRGPGVDAPGPGRWTLSLVVRATERRWGHRYSRGAIRRILHEQGFRWLPPTAMRASGPDAPLGGGRAFASGWTRSYPVIRRGSAIRRPRRG